MEDRPSTDDGRVGVEVGGVRGDPDREVPGPDWWEVSLERAEGVRGEREGPLKSRPGSHVPCPEGHR